MRRFSSEGSLLCLDIFPWKNASEKDDFPEEEDEPGTYRTSPRIVNQADHGATPLSPMPAAPQASVSRTVKELTRELSFCIEDINERDLSPELLKVTNLNESFKAYSDSQLAPNALSSGESVDKDDVPSPSSMSAVNPPCLNSGSHQTPQNRHHVRSKLSSAKLHLKSLFGQVRGAQNFLDFQISINIQDM